MVNCVNRSSNDNKEDDDDDDDIRGKLEDY
jgi:hypothetical protein